MEDWTVYVETQDEMKVKTHTLLVQSLVMQQILHQLRLNRHSEPMLITGVQDTASGISTRVISFFITSVTSSHHKCYVNAAIVSNVSSDLPLPYTPEAKL